MTREELLSVIQGELGENTQITERSINGFIDGLSLADNDNYGEDFAKSLAGVLKGSISGNISAVAAGAVKAKDAEIAQLKAQLEAANAASGTGGHNNGQQQQQQSQNQPQTEVEKQLAELKKQFEAMTTAQQNREDAEVISTLRKEIGEAFKSKQQEAKLSVNTYIFNQTLKEVEVKKDTKVDDAVKTLETAYNKALKEAGLDGGYNPRGAGRVGGQGSKSTVDAFFAKKAAKEGWGKK